MTNQEAKKILKIALFIYVASFLIINWNDVSWIFNYREVGGLISDFFNPYPTISASSMDAYFYPNRSETAGKKVEKVKATATDKPNSLEIPKISLSVPIVFPGSADTNVIMKSLDLGVVFYPGSVFPGQEGQMVILGHSAPVGWPKVKHDWVFSELEKLEPGDEIYINFNNIQYVFIVKNRLIIKRGAEVPSDGVENNNELALVSCWPPGKDYQRIAVQAELLVQ